MVNAVNATIPTKNHAENARVHPVFHPWAIVAELALIVLSYKVPKR